MDGHEQSHDVLQLPHPPTSSVIKVSIAVLSVLVSFLSGMVVASFKAGGTFSEFVTWKDAADKRISALEAVDLLIKADFNAQILQMNREGTWASKRQLETETAEMKKIEERLMKAEENGKKIDTMLFKIENLSAAVNELKAQKR